MASPARRPRPPVPTLPSLPDAVLQVLFDALSARPATATASPPSAVPPPAPALAAVCRRLSDYYHADHVTALAAAGGARPRDVAAALARFPRARELRLRFHGRVPFDIAAALDGAGAAGPAAARIRVLELQGLRLPPAAVADVARLCPRLRGLVLLNCSPSVRDADVEALVSALAGSLRLLHLGITGRMLTDAAGEHLSRLTSLAVLNLSGCTRLTDATFLGLGALGRTLTELSLSNTSVSDAGAASVSRMPLLRALDMSGCVRLTPAVLTHLPASLAMLNVQVTSVLTDGTPPAALDAAALPMLTDLDASYAEDLTSWTPLGGVAPRLRALDLSLSALRDGDAVSGPGLPGIGACATLAAMCALRHLNLSHCGALGDEAARGAASLPLLESLRMSFTGVTDAGVRSLAKGAACETLRELDLSYCEQISDRPAALALLGASFVRNDAAIVFDFGDEAQDDVNMQLVDPEPMPV